MHKRGRKAQEVADERLCIVRTGWRPVTHLLNRATPESFEFPMVCQCAKVAEIPFLGTKQHTCGLAHVHFIARSCHALIRLVLPPTDLNIDSCPIPHLNHAQAWFTLSHSRRSVKAFWHCLDYHYTYVHNHFTQYIGHLSHPA